MTRNRIVIEYQSKTNKDGDKVAKQIKGAARKAGISRVSYEVLST